MVSERGLRSILRVTLRVNHRRSLEDEISRLQAAITEQNEGGMMTRGIQTIIGRVLVDLPITKRESISLEDHVKKQKKRVDRYLLGIIFVYVIAFGIVWLFKN